MMMEALGSFETSVVTRATRRNMPEDGTVESYMRNEIFLAIPISAETL
jgi:hypothetical protein